MMGHFRNVEKRDFRIVSKQIVGITDLMPGASPKSFARSCGFVLRRFVLVHSIVTSENSIPKGDASRMVRLEALQRGAIW